jgi:hypothetical protein
MTVNVENAETAITSATKNNRALVKKVPRPGTKLGHRHIKPPA